MADGGTTGIDEARVGAWYAQHAPGTVPPLTFRMIAGGHSNLTYEVVDGAGARTVFRRPPLSHALASAHDMGREHRIIAALQGSAVPVPPVVGMCADESVNGAPFYVMRFVDGHVVRDRAAAESLLDEAARGRAWRSLVDTLAALHRIDPAAVGLGDLGRHEGYIERQLKRWYGQWNASKTRELALIDDVHAGLSARVPAQHGTSIVHGDYRLDNCIVSPGGDVAAVLDWELCTLGDPLADLGLLMTYWTGPGDEEAAGALTASGARPASSAPGFADRRDLAVRYAEASGRDVSGIDYYVSFAHWKLACILEGVYARYRAGAMGTIDPSMLDGFARQVEGLARRASDALSRLP
ncbi:MAG: phosphotransferase family protein [Acidobacteria bacterium]|nr:phosphotransferase family protein [Acidobacteriota bacterium]